MSTQINQYLIYGARLDYKDYPDSEMFEKFLDSAFDDVMNPGGLHCLFDGMDGKYIYIGRCFAKSKNHAHLDSREIAPVSPDIAEMTRLLIKAELGIEAPMAFHFVTHYR